MRETEREGGRERERQTDNEQGKINRQDSREEERQRLLVPSVQWHL